MYLSSSRFLRLSKEPAGDSPISTEYYIWTNFAVGAALNYFKMDVDPDDDDWTGSLDYEYWGPAAYIKARF